MKTYRFFYMAVVAILVCVGLAGCKDDDEEDNSVEVNYDIVDLNNNESYVYHNTDSCWISFSNFVGVNAKGETVEVVDVELLSNGTLIERKHVENDSVSFVIDNASLPAGEQIITAKFIAENGSCYEKTVHEYTIYDTLYGTYSVSMTVPAFIRELCDATLITWYDGGDKTKTPIDVSGETFETAMDFTVATYNTIPFNVLIYIQPKENIAEILAASETDYTADDIKIHEESLVKDKGGKIYSGNDANYLSYNDFSADDFLDVESAKAAINKRGNFISFTFQRVKGESNHFEIISIIYGTKFTVRDEDNYNK